MAGWGKSRAQADHHCMKLEQLVMMLRLEKHTTRTAHNYRIGVEASAVIARYSNTLSLEAISAD